MTAIPTTKTDTEYVLYCGEKVELLSVENGVYGNLAIIAFDNGREDEVPLSTIQFID